MWAWAAFRSCTGVIGSPTLLYATLKHRLGFAHGTNHLFVATLDGTNGKQVVTFECILLDTLGFPESLAVVPVSRLPLIAWVIVSW
jgi:hypothetical protein